VRLGALLQRDGSGGSVSGRGGGAGGGAASGAPSGLDAVADWASMLSLGEQQRLAFARCGGGRPRASPACGGQVEGCLCPVRGRTRQVFAQRCRLCKGRRAAWAPALQGAPRAGSVERTRQWQ
jgi:hypothetical protein